MPLQKPFFLYVFVRLLMNIILKSEDVNMADFGKKNYSDLFFKPAFFHSHLLV